MKPLKAARRYPAHHARTFDALVGCARDVLNDAVEAIAAKDPTAQLANLEFSLDRHVADDGWSYVVVEAWPHEPCNGTHSKA